MSLCKLLTGCVAAGVLIRQVGFVLSFNCTEDDCFANCSTNVGTCEFNTSLVHASKCVYNVTDGIQCECFPGFTGEFCESDVNECKGSPCQHGGTCINSIGSYTCHCTRDRDGSHCHRNTNYLDVTTTTTNVNTHHTEVTALNQIGVKGKDEHSNVGMIAGVVVGAVVCLAAGVIAVITWKYKRRVRVSVVPHIRIEDQSHANTGEQSDKPYINTEDQSGQYTINTGDKSGRSQINIEEQSGKCHNKPEEQCGQSHINT